MKSILPAIIGIGFSKAPKYVIILNNLNPQKTQNRMHPKLLIDILGWTGSILYLLAYVLVSLKRAEGDSVVYQSMNILAGVLLVVYTLSLGAHATTGLNAVWVAIGILTLGRKWLTRN
jgi:hypothetical protein